MAPKFGFFVISIVIFAIFASLWKVHEANSAARPAIGGTLFRKLVEFKRQVLYDELKLIRDRLDTRLSKIPTVKPSLMLAPPTTSAPPVCSLGICKPPCVGPRQPFLKCPSHCKDC